MIGETDKDNIVVLLTSKHLVDSDFNSATVQLIHADWAKCIGRDVSDYEGMFQDHLVNLRAVLGSEPAPRPRGLFNRLFGSSNVDGNSTDVSVYRFAICFASGKYLTGHGARQATQQQLNLIHAEHLKLIRALLDVPDRVMTNTPLPGAKGTLGEVAGAALLSYFHHTDFGPQGRRLRAEAAHLVPKLLRRFAYLDSNLIVSILGDHPSLVDEAGSLIQDIFRDPGHDPERGPYGWIGQNMTGFYALREDPFQKYGPKIMAHVLADAAVWPRENLSNLARVFAFDPLDLTIGTAEEEAQKALDGIAREEARIAEGFDGPDNSISPQQAEQFSRERLKAAKARLKQIETGFDSVRAEHFTAAAKHLAKANGARKTVEIIARALPVDLAAPLKEALAKADAIKMQPVAFPMPKASDNRFKDIGLKFMVIDELMYVQKRLLPLFDIRQFAEEWTKREISIEDDGYDVIPEAMTYFKNLAIPGELLSHVEVLTQKSGLDGGGGGVIEQMVPFWDPGGGDGPVPVTNKAAVDLDLLPNLTCIVGLEHEVNEPKPRKLLQELEKRGINTIPESLAIWGKD
ncbi:hypothetical protein R1T40_22050 (plasmid) [Tritonibacter scottomollicae]|uniref:DUF6892 domain-containing protein n=1 Tax=Tritonibacter scottomollicae TaxID=483013 RepID=A0A2T1AAK1_TRISK|nr:hypothetical protein [Tritonibacter scottomollicae]PRZ45626.1 hypothetical protein CLV89_11477 [Tritonibacter scottomollicae]WOI35425.1 hypothetical protein R1T40_22050 [Tritonibacter scottomollicae]